MNTSPLLSSLHLATNTIRRILNLNRFAVLFPPFQSGAYTNMAINGCLADDQSKTSTRSGRPVAHVKHDTLVGSFSLAIPEWDDDLHIRELYRPFILDETKDWISDLELEEVMHMAEGNIRETGERLKILVLYGSLRQRLVLPVSSAPLVKLHAIEITCFLCQVVLPSCCVRGRSDSLPAWL
jgi:hypothetical protein